MLSKILGKTIFSAISWLMCTSCTINKIESKIAIPKELQEKLSKEQQLLVYYNSIIDLLRKNYVQKLNDEELLEKTIKGILSELDIHTTYLDEKTLKELQETTDGEFGGLGIEIIPYEGFIKIVHPMEDSPAFKANILPGDIVTHIDGEFIYKEPYELVIKKMRGEPGTKVTLTINRKYKSPFDVEITREIIKIPFLKHEEYEGIIYMRIGMFYNKLSDDIKKAIKSYKKKKIKGVIIDIRYNSGGLLQEAIAVTNLFLAKHQEIVTVKGRPNDKISVQTTVADGTDILKGIPIVILINGNSASASEIFAGSMQYNKRALIVGEQSFGKGSVQTVIPLEGGSAIKMTIAKFFVGGKCIQYNGVTPDIVIEPKILKEIPDIQTIREKDISKEWLNSPEAKAEMEQLKQKNRKKDIKKSDNADGKNAEKSNKNLKQSMNSNIKNGENVENTNQKNHLSHEKNDKNKRFENQIIEKINNSENKNAENESNDPILLLFKKYTMEERLEKDLQLIAAFNAVKTLAMTNGLRKNLSKKPTYLEDYKDDIKNIEKQNASDFKNQ